MSSQRLSGRSSGGSLRSRSSGSARVLNELPMALSVSSPSLAGSNSGVALTGSLAWNQRRTVRVEPRAAVTTSSAVSSAQHSPRKTLASVSSASSVHNRPLMVGQDVPNVVSPAYPAVHFSPPEAGLRPVDSARRELVSRLLAKGVPRWEPVDPVTVQGRKRPTSIHAASPLQDMGNRSHTTSNGLPNGTGAHGAIAPYWETAAKSDSSLTSSHPINSGECLRRDGGLGRHGGDAASESNGISRARAAVPYWEPVLLGDDPGRQTRPLSSRLSHPNDSESRKHTFGHQRDFISSDNLASSDMFDFRDGPVMQWRSSEFSSRQMATVTEAPSIHLQAESDFLTDRRVAPLSKIQPSTKLRKMPSRRKSEPKRYVADGIMRKIAPKPNVAFFCDLNVEDGHGCDTAKDSDVVKVSAAAQTVDERVAVHPAAAVLHKTDTAVEMTALTAADVQEKPPAAVKKTSGKKKGSDLEERSKIKRLGAVGNNGASKDAVSGESGALASSSYQSLTGAPEQKRSRPSTSPRISNTSTHGSPTGSKRKFSGGRRRTESRVESPASVHKPTRTVKITRNADPVRSPSVTRGRSAASGKLQSDAPTRMPIGGRRGRSLSARSGGSAATAGASGSSRGSAGSLQRKPSMGAGLANATAAPPQSRLRRSQSRTDTERAELQVFMEQRKAQQRIVQTQQQRQLERQRATKRQRLEALNWECRRLRRAAPVHTFVGGIRGRVAQTVAAARGSRQRTQLLTRSHSVGAISDRPWTAAATQRLRGDFVSRGTSPKPLELRPASAPRSAFRFSGPVRGPATGAAARRQLLPPARRLRGGALGSKKPRNICTSRSRLSSERMGVFTADTEKRYHETRTLLENMSPPRQRAASAGVGGSLRTLTDLQGVRTAVFDSSPGGSMVEVYYVSSSECSDCEAAAAVEVHVPESSTSAFPSRPQSAVSGASRSAPCVLHSRCPPPGAHRRLFEPGSAAASCGGELETLVERSASCSQLDSSCGSSLQSQRAVVGTPRATAEEHNNTAQSSHVSSGCLQTMSQQDLPNAQPLSEQRLDGIDTAGTGGTGHHDDPDEAATVSCQFPNWFLLPPPLLCADTFASALRRKLLCAGSDRVAEQLLSGRPASPTAPPVTCHELVDKSVQVSTGSLLLMTSSQGSPTSLKCEERPGRRGGSPESLMLEDLPGRLDSVATQPPNVTGAAADLSQSSSSSDVSSLPSLSSQCSSVSHRLAAPVWCPERSADGFVTLPVEHTCLTATATPAGIKAMSVSLLAGQTTVGVEASPKNAAAGSAGIMVTQGSRDDTWVSPRCVSSSNCKDQRSGSAQLNSCTSFSVSSLDSAASGVDAKSDRKKRSTNSEKIWPSDSDDFSEATKRIVDEYKARLKARREMRRADRIGGDSSDTSSASGLHPSVPSSSKRNASSCVVLSAAVSGSNSGQVVSSNGRSSSHSASSSNRLEVLSVGGFGIKSLSETGRTTAPVGDKTIPSGGSSSGSVGSSTPVDPGSTFTEETTGSSDDSSTTVNGDEVRESPVPVSSVKRADDDSAASSSNSSFRASILYSVQSSAALASGRSVPKASSVNQPGGSTVSSGEKFTPSAASESISTISSLRNMMALASSMNEEDTVSSLRNMMATASSVSEIETVSSLLNMMVTASSVSEVDTVSSLRNVMATVSSMSEVHTALEQKSASMVSTAVPSSVSSVSSSVSRAPSVEESICVGSSDDDSVQIVDVPRTSSDIQHVHAAPKSVHKTSGTSESVSGFSRVSPAVEVTSVLDGPSALESVATVSESFSKVTSDSQSSNRSLKGTVTASRLISRSKKATVPACDSVSTTVSVRQSGSDLSAVLQSGGVSVMKRIFVSSAWCSLPSSASSTTSTVARSSEVMRADSPDPPSGTVSHVESVPLDTPSGLASAPSAESSSATDTVSSALVSAGSSCDDQSVSASDVHTGDGRPTRKTGQLAVAALGATAGCASSGRQTSIGTRQASMDARQVSVDTRQASVEGKPTHRLGSMDFGAMSESARSSEKSSFQLRSSAKQPLQTSSKASSPTSQTSQLVDSFTRFTLDMRRQLLQEEEQRALHRLALVDVQKKRILDNINADIKKLEMEKRKYKSDGVRTSAIRKKQRALLLKLDERKTELDRLKETDRVASRERQLMIVQCEELLKQVADVSEPQPANQIPLERQRSVTVHSASSVSTEPSVFSTSPRCSAMTSGVISSAGRVAAGGSLQFRPSAVSTSSTGSITSVSSAAASCSVPVSAAVQSPMAAAGGSSAPGDICSTPAIATDRQQLNIKSPLAPHLDVRSHRRRHSSGSDDSISICLTETCSDQSDMEGRIVALEEELKRRKLEAERLRREQKRQDRERLRLQELSLKKQIEAYDSRIRTTVLELETQRSLQDSSHLQSKSRPVIGRPRQTERRSSPATSPSASCSTTSRASERLQLSPGSVSESQSSRTGKMAVGKDCVGGDEEVIPAAKDTRSHPTSSCSDGGDSPTAAVSHPQADGRHRVFGPESVTVNIEVSDAKERSSPYASESSLTSLEPPSDMAVQDGKTVSADSSTISVNSHDTCAASGSSQTYDEAESSVAEGKSMVVDQIEDEDSGGYAPLQPLKLLVSDQLNDKSEVVQTEEFSGENVVTSSVEFSKAVEESTVRKRVDGLPSCLTTVADDHQTGEVKAASPENHHVTDSIGSSEIVSFCKSQTSEADKILNVGESCGLKDLEATNVSGDVGKEEGVESPEAEEVSEGNTSSNVLTEDDVFISEGNDGNQNVVQLQHAEVVGAIGEDEVGKERTLIIDEKGDVPAFLSDVGAVREIESGGSRSSGDSKLELSEEPKFHEAGDLPVLSAQDVSDVVRSVEEFGALDESDVVNSAVSSQQESPEESQVVVAVSEAYSEDFDALETSSSPSESSSSSIAEDIKLFSAQSTVSSNGSLMAHLTCDFFSGKVQQSQGNVLGSDILSASQIYPTHDFPKEHASDPPLPHVTETNEGYMQSVASGNTNVAKVITENELSILMDKLFIKSGRSSKDELVNAISQSIIENLLRDSLAGGMKARSPAKGNSSGLSCYEEAVSSLTVNQTDESDLFMSPRKIEQPSVFGTPVAVIGDVIDGGTDQTGERTGLGPVVLLDTKTPACEDVELVFSPSSSVPVFGSASLANAQGNVNAGGCLETGNDCDIGYQTVTVLKFSEQQPEKDASWNRSTECEVVDTQADVTPSVATSSLVSSKAERIVKKIIDDLFEDSWRELKRMYEVSKVPIVGSEPLPASSSARESAIGNDLLCSTEDVGGDGGPVWTAQPVFPSPEVHQLSSGLDRLEHTDYAEDVKLQMRERLIEDEIRQLEVLQKLSRGVIYMREIPDRPPPPYREPDQLPHSTLPSAAAVVLDPPASAVSLSRADQQRLQQPLPQHLVPHGAAEVAPLLQQALELVHAGCDPSQFVESADSPDGRARDPLAASARRQFRQFILCYAEQSVSAELSAAAGDDTAVRRRAWVRPRAARRTAALFRRDRAAVDERVQQRLAVALGHRPAAARENLMVRWARKRRDLVDEVLVRELHEEEADWLDYSVEEAAVKRQLGLHMWDDLLSDSIGELLRIWHKRHVKQTDL